MHRRMRSVPTLCTGLTGRVTDDTTYHGGLRVLSPPVPKTPSKGCCCPALWLCCLDCANTMHVQTKMKHVKKKHSIIAPAQPIYVGKHLVSPPRYRSPRYLHKLVSPYEPVPRVAVQMKINSYLDPGVKADPSVSRRRSLETMLPAPSGTGAYQTAPATYSTTPATFHTLDRSGTRSGSQTTLWNFGQTARLVTHHSQPYCCRGGENVFPAAKSNYPHYYDVTPPKSALSR